MENGDCVYILSGQVVNEYKIGKTHNIFQRLSTFKTASPDIKVRHLCYTPNKDFVEKNMHELYKLNSTDPKHEWFKFANIEPVIRKLEVVAEDYLSEEQELTFNDAVKRHWYRELKFIAKSEAEKNIIIGKYDFTTESVVPLEKKEMMLCFRFGLGYEELEDYSAEPEDDPWSDFGYTNISKPKLGKVSPEKVKPVKVPSTSLRFDPVVKSQNLYCKHILTKGQKKGEACGVLITAKPANLCSSHAKLKNICRFEYSRAPKKGMICAIKIKEGEYCPPHQYVRRRRQEKVDEGEELNEIDEDVLEGEYEEEEKEGEEDGQNFLDCDESPDEEGPEPDGEPAQEKVATFKSVQENLMFLYKDLCSLGFVRPCSRCKTLYTSNYFVKKGRVCHFCKTEWY